MAASLIERMELFGRLAEQDCSAGALRVAFALLYRFYNGTTGRCDPGQSAIARAAGITPRHVKRAIDELKAAAWFEVQVGAGTTSKFGPTTAYFPRFDRVTSSSGDDESVGGSEGVTSSSGDDKFGREGVTALSPRTKKRTSSTLSGSSWKETATQFESFWRIYPRREGGNPKKPAVAKFASAVGRGVEPAAIIRGAEIYAAEMDQTGKLGTQYVAQAQTWLNQERWADYQTEPQSLEARLRAGIC